MIKNALLLFVISTSEALARSGHSGASKVDTLLLLAMFWVIWRNK